MSSFKHLSLFFLSLSSVLATPTALFARADCKTQTVVAGDSCASLATKCGISPADFTKYNPASGLCSSLAPEQRVCCSSGSLPSAFKAPSAGSDGTCATYLTKKGDSCSSIAAAHGLKVQDLSKLNDGGTKTWGWSGCDSLMAGINICLSEGKQPLPAPVDGAVCGPTVPGTRYNASLPGGLNQYNPCPLHACCNVWGQCGTTEEFCVYKQGPTGNPGTSPKGMSACVQSCDDDQPVDTGDVPASFLSVGYFETWSLSRPCLHMRIGSIDTSRYSHVHWAFGIIRDDFTVAINDTEQQWSSFLALDGVKRVLSFGGWDFSTSPSTYHVFRDMVKAEHRDKAAANIAAFIQDNKLDGVDVDWEYPGAPDVQVQGVPPGNKDDGDNYLAFLEVLRSKLDKTKSISIAAPASYWYLKQFPISDISQVVDYIVYMTYDLHGQWDNNNKWSQTGCANGDCLRSHVNLTETMYALTMITKANVQSKKVVVGVASYGRSFQMSQPNCIGPDCHYTGQALPGQCTATSGILANAEIGDILYNSLMADDKSAYTFYDTKSNSDIMVYNNTQWVAYLSETTRASRTQYYKDMHFGGVVDWAMSLREYHYDDEQTSANQDYDEGLPDSSSIPKCDATFDSLEKLASTTSIPSRCQALYTLQTLEKVYDDAIKRYQDLMHKDYDNKFKTYAQAVSDSAGKSIRDFMDKHGNDYFTCVIPEATLCCDHCSSGSDSRSCMYCNHDQCYHETMNKREDDMLVSNSSLVERDHPHSQQVLTVTYYNQSEPCPPDVSKRGYGSIEEKSIYWTLRDDKSGSFWADILKATGIPKSKISFSRSDFSSNCENNHGPKDACWNTGHYFNYPVPNGYGAGDVSNPKDVVTKALGNSNDMHGQLKVALTALKTSAYSGEASQLVDAISLPVLMVSDAVDSMASIETTAEKIDEEKKKAIIMAFLGALLFFIPIAGEVLGAATGIAEIATILAVVAAAGDAAMGIVSIVEDPQHPLMGIISIVLAPLSLASITKVTKASDLRRSMSDDDIAKLGGTISKGMGSIKKVIGVCKR